MGLGRILGYIGLGATALLTGCGGEKVSYEQQEQERWNTVVGQFLAEPNYIEVKLCGKEFFDGETICFVDIDGDGKTVEQYLHINHMRWPVKNVVECGYELNAIFGGRNLTQVWDLKQYDTTYVQLRKTFEERVKDE